MSIHGSIRVRPESRTGAGFLPGNDDVYTLTRVRLSLDVQPKNWLRGFVQVQDARAPAKREAASPFRDPFDFHQGFVELGPAAGKVRARIGRQELAYGEERLISPAVWRNVGRTFDGVRLLLGNEAVGVDLIETTEAPVDTARFNRWHRGTRLTGAYAHLNGVVGSARIEPYLLRTANSSVRSELGEPGREARYTAGFRLVQPLEHGVDVSMEFARQFGSSARDNIGAWMGAWMVHYSPAGVAWSPRISGEYSQVSGDKDPLDGRNGTFDSLFLTAHRYYGFADIVGARNVRDARAGVALRPRKGMTLNADLHNLWLAARRDSLYAPSQRVAVRSPSQRASRTRIGSELDLTFMMDIRAGHRAGAGYTRLFRGGYLQDQTAGAGGSYAYLVWSVDF